jgi:hypothetical protein
MALQSRLSVRKIAWAGLLTPAAGCLGYVLLIIYSLVVNGSPPVLLRDAAGLLVFSFIAAAVLGGMFAAPVTLVVLPIVRCLLPGRDKISLSALALAGLIFGFLSPVAMTYVMESARGVVRTNDLLGYGSMGAGSGLIMAFVWFYLTLPAPGTVGARIDWRSAMRKLTNVTEVIAYIAAHAVGIAFSLLGGSAFVFMTARSYGYQNLLGVSLIYSVVLMLIVMLLFLVFRAMLSPATSAPRE